MKDSLTFRELAELIERLPEENKDDDVTVFVRGVDEYYPAETLRVHVGDDILHNGHPYLTV